MKKVLIIDDSPIARKILKSCFPQTEPLEVYEESDGLRGFQQFERLQPDLTFVDLTMPVMGGMEVLERIRDTRPGAIVIVASADIQPLTREKVMSLGAFAFLKKPPTPVLVAEVFENVAHYQTLK